MRVQVQLYVPAAVVTHGGFTEVADRAGIEAMATRGVHYCVDCGGYTEWKPLRGGAHEVCLGCGTKYPCARCDHVDCIADRTRKRRQKVASTING